MTAETPAELLVLLERLLKELLIDCLVLLLQESFQQLVERELNELVKILVFRRETSLSQKQKDVNMSLMEFLITVFQHASHHLGHENLLLL